MKVFCVGHHKTGTTTLVKFGKSLGFNAVHDIRWSKKGHPRGEKQLKRHNFFSDGGGHFYGQGNHNLEHLRNSCKNPVFILNTRSLLSWLTSKLIHMKDKEPKYNRETVKQWIRCRIKYHQDVIDFATKHSIPLIAVDVCGDPDAAAKLCRFLKKKFIEFPHANRTQTSNILKSKLKAFGKSIIEEMGEDPDTLHCPSRYFDVVPFDVV